MQKAERRSPPPDDVWWSTKETADYLNVAQKTLWDWRYRGGGPPFHKARGRLYYRKNEVDAWILQNG